MILLIVFFRTETDYYLCWYGHLITPLYGAEANSAASIQAFGKLCVKNPNMHYKSMGLK
jgi:hypothetical protein